ncbi:hypothetical protein Scep_027794 [Stephania cephalantha]|uniref:Uncharacterized protein n=1 Tax=Stephania cephalantha TaxID=152367 RepID=A0AAP0ED94_9MAGN
MPDKGKRPASANKFAPLTNPPNIESQYRFSNRHLVFLLDSSLLEKPLADQIKTILPPSLHFIPYRPNITIKFYETILTTTGSAVIEHFSNQNSEEIAYSKLKIQKVLSITEWTQQLSVQQSPFIYQSMTLVKDKHPAQVNYKDYIDAWRHILFYKDPSSGHSWYLTFKKSLKVNLPNWFIAEWWTKFGPPLEIFPFEVYKKFTAEKLTLFQFLHKHSIPWILKWHYGTHTITTAQNQVFTYLAQEIQCKWWDKFNVNSIDISIPSAPSNSKQPTINLSKHPADHQVDISPPPEELEDFPPLPKTYKEAIHPPADSTSANTFDLQKPLYNKFMKAFSKTF